MNPQKVMQAKSHISYSFDYSHELQMVKTHGLREYRDLADQQVRPFILKNGFQEPIIIS